MRPSNCPKLTVLIGVGLVSVALADPNAVSPKSGGSNTEPVTSGAGAGSASSGSSSSGSSSGSSSQGGSNYYYQPSNDDGRVDDHGESLDAGAPVRGAQRHEKVLQVDSLKSLPSTGLDAKFQGSLIDNSIESIKKFSPKANGNANTSLTQPTEPRFQSKTLTLINEMGTTDQQKKTGAKPAQAKSDATPSATPSPTVSPAAKVSEESKH